MDEIGNFGNLGNLANNILAICAENTWRYSNMLIAHRNTLFAFLAKYRHEHGIALVAMGP